MRQVDIALQQFVAKIPNYDQVTDIDDFDHEEILQAGMELVEGMSIAELRTAKRQIERTRYEFFMSGGPKNQLLRSVLLLLVSTELRLRRQKHRLIAGRP